MSSTNDIKYLIGFTKTPGIGRVRLALLKEYFGNLSNAWKAPKAELLEAGLDKKTVESINTFRQNFSLDRELDLLDKYKIRAVSIDSAEYPSLLKEIDDCPVILYVRGSLFDYFKESVAVVGTRRPTAYGRQVTENLVADLVTNGLGIISGLAKGIDTVAHRSAIDSGGRTIAVFASGLDVVYPPQNLNLAKDIIEHGALVSEYGLGMQPKAENFPRRNRILSGLSKGVVVIESGESGGALITAGFALEQNREVFAVPGSVFSSMSKGPNRLIQQGAKLVKACGDILEELNLTEASYSVPIPRPRKSDKEESLILNCITEEPLHVDEICRGTGLSASTVISKLAIMELDGLVRQFGAMSYMLIKNRR